MRKLTAFKRSNLSEPVEWELRHNKKPVFHLIEVVDEAIETSDGVMIHVHIRGKVDFADPNNDIVALVGKAIARSKLGRVDPQSPELWFWRDKFWVKAVDSLGAEYYHKKAYLFYEVDVNADEILPELDFE